MIRFQRIGRKNDPSFRMLVLEKTSSPKAGTYVEQVGTYNPKTKAFNADGEKIKGWIAKGAQVSPSLHNLLITKGILEGKKINVLPLKTPIKPEVVEEPAAPAPVAEAPAETAPVAEVVEVPVESAPVVEEVASAEATPEASVPTEAESEAAVAEVQASEETPAAA